MKELETGTVVDGRYSIEGLLGRGGFAAVYKAHHQRLNKSVALKVLDLPDVPMDIEPFVKRFMREAQVSARIEHANIVSVFDYGVIEASTQPYIAMEFLEGHDLEHELKHNGALEIDRLVRLFVPALDAIGDAHKNGVVHKDLKPSNLFLVHPGTAKERLVVLDFGIARFFEEKESRLTQTGGFSGTPAYLAPEYIESQIVSPALDVYQMGLILIEALIGKQAVQADNAMAYMLAHCSGSIEIPAGLADTEIGNVLRKAVSRDPTARHRDGDVLSDALKRAKMVPISIPEITSNRPVPQETLPVPPDASPPTLGYWITVAALVLLILGIVGGFLYWKTTQQPVGPTPEEIAAQKLAEEEQAQNELAKLALEPTEEKTVEEIEPVEVEPEVKISTVRINSLPASEVFVENKSIGITPTTYDLREGEKATVRLEAPGYDEVVKEISSSQTKVSIRLKKSRVAQRTPKKTKPKKKKPVEKEPIKKVPKAIGIVN